jgi:hypothetical protein
MKIAKLPKEIKVFSRGGLYAYKIMVSWVNEQIRTPAIQHEIFISLQDSLLITIIKNLHLDMIFH